MNVMVTGAFGYFGTALVLRLAREHDVIAAGRGSWRAKTLPENARIGPKNCAIFSKNLNAVVHLAGGGASGGDMSDPYASLRDNVDSAREALGCGGSENLRFILASSVYVYGEGGPFKESAVCRPDTLYGMQKRIAESLWLHDRGSCDVALRFAHIYGDGSGVDFGRDGVTERMARAAVGGGKVTLYKDHSLDLVHIVDACEAVALALTARELPPVLNISAGHHPVAGLAAGFGLHCPGGWWVKEQLEHAEAPHRLRILDSTLAGDVLGWRPRVDTKDGIAGLVSLFRGGSGG